MGGQFLPAGMGVPWELSFNKGLTGNCPAPCSSRLSPVVDSLSTEVHSFVPEDHQLRGRLRFGVFELDLRAGELRKHGMRVRLQEQPFQVLAMLLEHPGEVVTREELQKKLWSADTFVDFDHGLNKAINKIREALSDSAESPRFVETVARRGYRFLADVKIADAALVGNSELATRAPHAAEARDGPDGAGKLAKPKPLLPSRAWKILAFALLLLVASLVTWKLHSWNRP